MQLRAGLYITVYLVCSLTGYVLAFFAANPATNEVLPAVPIPFVVLGIFQLVFVYKMYKALDDGVTRPRPGAAVGFFFIPIFSIIWYFVVWGKYAGQYNQFIQRHGVRAQPLGGGLVIAALIIGIAPIPGLFLWCAVYGRIARAVNALSQ